MSVSSPDKKYPLQSMDKKIAVGILFSFSMFFFPIMIPLSHAELKTSGGFPTRFFLAGAALEFTLSLLIIILHLYSGLKRRRYKQMEYLLRIILGLPLTIILASEVSAGFSVLIRFVFGIMFFRQIGYHRVIPQYVFFFSAGMLLYSFLENYPAIRADHIYLVIASILISAILGGMDNYYFNRLKKILMRR